MANRFFENFQREIEAASVAETAVPEEPAPEEPAKEPKKGWFRKLLG